MMRSSGKFAPAWIGAIAAAGVLAACTSDGILMGTASVMPQYYVGQNANLVKANNQQATGASADCANMAQSCAAAQSYCQAADSFSQKTAQAQLVADDRLAETLQLQQQYEAMEKVIVDLGDMNAQISGDYRDARDAYASLGHFDGILVHLTPSMSLSHIGTVGGTLAYETEQVIYDTELLAMEMMGFAATNTYIDDTNASTQPISPMIQAFQASILATKARYEAGPPNGNIVLNKDPNATPGSPSAPGGTFGDLDGASQSNIEEDFAWLSGFSSDFYQLRVASDAIVEEMRVRQQAYKDHMFDTAAELADLADQSRADAANAQRNLWLAAQACGQPLPPDLPPLDQPMAWENPFGTAFTPVPDWNSTFWDFSSP